MILRLTWARIWMQRFAVLEVDISCLVSNANTDDAPDCGMCECHFVRWQCAILAHESDARRAFVKRATQL